MSYCYHPLRALDFGVNEKTGKRNIKILKGEYSPKELEINGVKVIPIPCGRCIGCRLNYSRQWADRCMLEAQYHVDNMFLTLTYDDEHLPPCKTSSIDKYDVDGEYIGTEIKKSKVHSLDKKELQAFIKRLRKKFPDQKFRYFACGEYSPRMRPHYHLIIFGLHLDDLQFKKRDLRNGYIYYTSETIKDVWSDVYRRDNKNYSESLGFHLITDVSWDTCAYTARYIMKKQNGSMSIVYDDMLIDPEFTIMSRKPGIGAQYFYDHPDIALKSHFIPTRDGAKEINSNRYFDKLFDLDYHDDLEWIKEDRVKRAELKDKLLNEKDSLTYSERLHNQEIYKQQQAKSLKRKEVL